MSDGAGTSTPESREAILEAVRRARPPASPLPELGLTLPEAGDLVAHFTASVEAVSGAARSLGNETVEAAVRSMHPKAGVMASPEKAWAFDDVADHDPAAIDVLVCRGAFGVAEDGAIWVPESRMGTRAAPYLAQHLVLVVDEIVPNLHAAYARIDIAAEGFGAFIAGPSKTADIEQALVIGAHGPRSLTVLVEGDVQ
jgi:L-lactate dehydrogenase complex protein LldG